MDEVENEEPGSGRHHWGTRPRVERYLAEHPRELVTTAALTEHLGVKEQLVSRALGALVKTMPGLEKRGRGRYIYVPNDLDDMGATAARLRVVNDKLAGGESTEPAKHQLLQEQRDLQGKLAALVERVAEGEGTERGLSARCGPGTGSPPHHFETVTLHRSGGVVLRDDNQDLWVAYPIPIERIVGLLDREAISAFRYDADAEPPLAVSTRR